MSDTASDAFVAWVADEIAPIARANGLTGKGPVFRKHDGPVWTVFALERRRKDPWEARMSATDPTVDFRMMAGFAIPDIRPAWDTRKGPPGMHDFTIFAPTMVLEPAEGEFWHVFEAADDRARASLTELVRDGLPKALDALGPATARAVLDTKLTHGGPLENLSPAGAEEMLALADLAGAADVRQAIGEALTRPRVPDPERDQVLRDMDEHATEFFGPGVQVVVMRPPRDDEIEPPIAGRRRTPRIRERLIAELDDPRPEVRRLAASALGAWSGDEAVLTALRGALGNADDYARVCAARSLGHLGDPDEGTWEQTLSIAAATEAGPTEVAEAIVLLAKIDISSRRQPASEAIGSLCLRFLADTRRLAGLASLLTSDAP